MQLSILLPAKDCDTTTLVQALVAQARLLPLDWELILLDDGTTDAGILAAHARLARATPGVRHIPLPQNVGRAAGRNLLATEACGWWLLFLDADAALPADGRFLQNYLNSMTADADVVVGGVAYQAAAPPKPQWFRWHYGRAREARPAASRRRSPYTSFSTFNFLVKKDILARYPFLHQLRQYGHEDTLLGLQWQQAGIRIVHIDNPALHLGLEDTESFLAKTRQGVENLAWLWQQNPDKQPVLLSGIRLLAAWRRLHCTQLGWVSALIWRMYQPIYRWLAKRWAGAPLALFDLYKLLYLCQCMRQTYATPPGSSPLPE